MIKVNMRDGSTVDVDLLDEESKETFKRKMENPFFKRNITGMILFEKERVFATIQKPKIYDNIEWNCKLVGMASFKGKAEKVKSEVVGECIELTIDNKVKNILYHYFSNHMVKSEIVLLD